MNRDNTNPVSQGSVRATNDRPRTDNVFSPGVSQGLGAITTDAGATGTAVNRSPRCKQGAHQPTGKAKTAQQEKDTIQKALPRFHLIQEWHIVLSDLQARSESRTTAATEMAREIKENYKQKFWGEKRNTWIPAALRELDEWLQKNWKDNKKADLGLVLVKCNKNTLARVQPGMSNKYGYKDDETPTFGIGKRKEALEFFFCSRDPPKLANEVKRHLRNLKRLREGEPHPPREEIEDFQSTLDFFRGKLDRERNGCILAKKLLKSLSPIQALNAQWKALLEQPAPVTDATQTDVTQTALNQPPGQATLANHGNFNIHYNTVQMPLPANDPCYQNNKTQPLFRGPPILPTTFCKPSLKNDVAESAHPTVVETNNPESDTLLEYAHKVGDVEEDIVGLVATGRQFNQSLLAAEGKASRVIDRLALESDRPVEKKARKSIESDRGALHGHTESSQTNALVETAVGDASVQGILGDLLGDIQADPDWQSDERQGDEQPSSEHDPTRLLGDKDPPYFVGYALDWNPVGGPLSDDSEGFSTFPQKDGAAAIVSQLPAESVHSNSDPDFCNFSLRNVLSASFKSYRRGSKTEGKDKTSHAAESIKRLEAQDFPVDLSNFVAETAPWLGGLNKSPSAAKLQEATILSAFHDSCSHKPDGLGTLEASAIPRGSDATDSDPQNAHEVDGLDRTIDITSSQVTPVEEPSLHGSESLADDAIRSRRARRRFRVSPQRGRSRIMFRRVRESLGQLLLQFRRRH